MRLLTALLLARLEAYTPPRHQQRSTALHAKRPFVHVPYGQEAPTDVKTLACDGRVKGATLDLSHWTDNTTPNDLYADTSTEIALNLAQSDKYAEYDDATVVNNHFDVDGVLSAWAATDPESALPHFQLLCDAAACGDFGEWPSDEGVKLCYAVAALETDEDDGGYASALSKLPSIVENLDAYEDLWGPGFASVCDDYDDMADGFGSVEDGAGDVALVMEPPGRRARAPAVDRQLREAGITPTRLLRASFFCGAQGFPNFETTASTSIGGAKRLSLNRLTQPWPTSSYSYIQAPQKNDARNNRVGVIPASLSWRSTACAGPHRWRRTVVSRRPPDAESIPVIAPSYQEAP